MMTSARGLQKTKTSVDILRERDALDARVRVLEAALVLIQREAELAQARPDLGPMGLYRVAALARRAFEGPAT